MSHDEDYGPPPDFDPPPDPGLPSDFDLPPDHAPAHDPGALPGRPDMGATAPALREGLSLPHAVEAEREVLSSVLVDPASMDTVLEIVTGQAFYLDRHGLVFEAMKRLYERAGTVDIVTLGQELKDSGTWHKAGGAATLADLAARAGSTSHLEHYCRIVRSKAMIREMIEAAQAIVSGGFGDISDVQEFLDDAERRVFAVLEEREQTSLRHVSDVVRSTIEQISKAFDSDQHLTGIGTGFRDLDGITHGLQGGDLIIVAARPAMGKTAFCLNLASNAALKHGASVAVFSLEMPAEQLATRLLAAEARIDVSRLRSGFLGEDDWPKLMRAADELSQARIHMDDAPGATPSAIRAKCRRLKRKYGLDLVIVDYLQLMQTGERSRSREQEISQISRSLKGLAKDLGAPVIALSQLNRGLESRTDKRPLMSDLRESGAIEQDADLIAFIYRDEVYKKDLEDSERGVTELIVAKHRNGPTGVVKLKFWHAWTRFDTLARD